VGQTTTGNGPDGFDAHVVKPVGHDTLVRLLETSAIGAGTSRRPT
jgi:hypothetical protein